MNMLRKHEGVINSLQIMACDTIKYLDKEHNQTTLRHFMMELTFPISPTAGQKTKGLIHSIDFASSGPDAGAKVQVTAYADRAELVSSLLNILPAFIEYQLDEETRQMLSEATFSPLSNNASSLSVTTTMPMLKSY